jgi:hypothetical protein
LSGRHLCRWIHDAFRLACLCTVYHSLYSCVTAWHGKLRPLYTIWLPSVYVRFKIINVNQMNCCPSDFFSSCVDPAACALTVPIDACMERKGCERDVLGQWIGGEGGGGAGAGARSGLHSGTRTFILLTFLMAKQK